MGSCTEKTSAPDEAEPAGACLSVRGRGAPPPSGSHAHFRPELSGPEPAAQKLSGKKRPQSPSHVKKKDAKQTGGSAVVGPLA